MKTIQQLAQEALNVQNACNLSGVVHGFSRAITELRELYPNIGGDELRAHPICVAWADKISSLVEIQDIGNPKSWRAFDELERIAKGEVAA